MSNLNLVFNLQGKSITLQCNPSETLNQVFKRYCTKVDLNINEIKFYKNSKELRGCEKTLSALDIKNYTTIDVTMAKYVIGA